MKRDFVEIHKFGGALFDSPKDLKNITMDILKRGNSVIFVCSAAGKMTRLLSDLYDAVCNEDNPSIMKYLYSFKEKHYTLIDSLVDEKSRKYDMQLSFDVYFRELENLTGEYHSKDSDASRAKFLVYGELCSSLIFKEYLDGIKLSSKAELIDARKLFQTKGSSFLEATLDSEVTLSSIFKICDEYICAGKIIITQGYIARNENGQNTVLGFDGSDLSAAIIALALSSKYILFLTFWKDVIGVYRDYNKHYLGIFDQITISDYVSFYKEFKRGPVRVDAVYILSGLDIDISIRSFKELSNPGTKII